MFRTLQTESFSVSLIMADLPRWIDDATVDSAAMLSAFEAFCAQHPHKKNELQQLFVIVHKCVFPPPVWTLPVMKCSRAYCHRCMQGRGGYQFRWWSQQWDQDYKRLARAGAWKNQSCRGTKP